MSFIYGLVYCLLEAYPYVFEEIYGFNTGVSGLPFNGLIVGQLLACAYILSEHTSYARKLAKNNNVPVPEWRLVPPLLGAPVFTIGIFWWVIRQIHIFRDHSIDPFSLTSRFGWTAFTPKIHWAVPTAAGIFIGFGVLCVFLPCFNYLVDAYLPL